MSIRNFLNDQAKRLSFIKVPESFDPDFFRPMRAGPCFITSNSSILRPDGEFVFIHTSDFAENILLGENCFLCGCFPNGVSFNNEHVIPDWLLRYTGISNMSITLPNGNLIRYSSYKVRSCAECNSFLSEVAEGPISRAIKGGFEKFSEFYNENPKLLFQWLSLIYYKVHFRDFSLRENLDRREPGIPIGARYAWPNFHHIFCVARSILFDARFSSFVIGSINIFELKDWEQHGTYDYRDHWLTDTMFIRIQSICICVSFTDAQVAKYMMQNKLSRVPHRVNYIQAVEIYGDFIAAKMHFKKQHDFHSFYHFEEDYLEIVAEISEDFDWYDMDSSIRGSAQAFAFMPDFGKLTMNGLSHEETFDEIASGETSFFPLEGGDEYEYVEHKPPDDVDHAKKLSMQTLQQEPVLRAFRNLTNDFYGDE